MGSLAPHKFVKLTEINTEFAELPKIDILENRFNYILELYMDYYIALDIPRSKAKIQHVANNVTKGIHDVFPPDKDNDKDEISFKEILRKEGAWQVIMNVLGFNFYRNTGGHTIWITEDLRTNISEKLKKWISEGENRKKGTPFEEFKTYLCRTKNAFISIPYGKELLSPCNQVLGKEPKNIFFIKKIPYCRLSTTATIS